MTVDDPYVERAASDDSDDTVEDDPFDDPYVDAPSSSAETREDETLVDEGVVALLLVVGLALFLFPEPVTTTLGMVLLAVGVLAWIAEALD